MDKSLSIRPKAGFRRVSANKHLLKAYRLEWLKDFARYKKEYAKKSFSWLNLFWSLPKK